MAYEFKKIEQKWRQYWKNEEVFKAVKSDEKEKFYILSMFPYPSGAGLHVGHPLGYIANDIFARYKRLKGYNVLHPMGYDAFGLPAEQYAIATGQHPAKTTSENITRYREQLDNIGFSFDWSREIKTCDPEYYKWTQWMFIELFESWYDRNDNKAKSIEILISRFEKTGNKKVNAGSHHCEVDFDEIKWASMNAKEKSDILLCYRMAYLANTSVNWCPELGTVLANDEVKNGLSVRGGHEVLQKKMLQWSLRVSAYAQRLLDGLEKVEWSDSVIEIQKNWIGKSVGANVFFDIADSANKIEVFTTRPDTLFGVSFMVVAPESELVCELTTSTQSEAVKAYQLATSKKTEMDRMSDVKNATGVFTGSYCIHPFSKERLEIWISDYVLAGYGTGAIMAVPAHDSRDYLFAKTFKLPINPVYEGGDINKEAYEIKGGICINSDFLNGLKTKKAISKMIHEVNQKGIGEARTNYRLRDATFSRQRYWGEPIPIYFKDGIPTALSKDELPLELPEVDKYLPTKKGEPPLGRAKNWTNKDGHPLELSTMPGFAGSSAYYFRYTDPKNKEQLVSKENNAYWGNVDLYVGGSEHATGHLIYSRFFNKFLYDRGFVQGDEPFQKMINQGMIQGRSNFVYRIKGENKFVSQGLKDKYDTQEIHVDVNIVDNDELDIEAFKSWRSEYKESEFILEDEKYKCGYAVEKMSKSLYNVVNPDEIVLKYGADTLRLYEMFLGPIEQSKPWSMTGIEGVSRFLQKVWKFCFDEHNNLILVDKAPSAEEYKIIHTAIKKTENAISTFSHNTAVSALMICINNLNQIKSKNLEVMNIFTLLLAPLAPFLSEELWELFGNKGTLKDASFPTLSEKYLVESTYKYPISINGKLKYLKEISLDKSKDEIEKLVLEDKETIEALGEKVIKKIIIVPKKIVNIVV